STSLATAARSRWSRSHGTISLKSSIRRSWSFSIKSNPTTGRRAAFASSCGDLPNNPFPHVPCLGGAVLMSELTQATQSAETTIGQLGPWFHNLHLPGNIQTAPDHGLGDFPNNKWRAIAPHLPKDLTGWTALDVGCNAGFYSFEL